MKIEFCINKSGELIGGTLVRNQEVVEEMDKLTIPSIVEETDTNGRRSVTLVESIKDTFRVTFQRLYERGVRIIHKLIIEDGIERIANGAFAGIDIEINTVYWPKTCNVIPQYCFSNSKIKSIVGIEEVEEIETAAFCGTLLKYFNWPSKCKEIPMECFWKCNRLEQIDGLEVIINIGDGAFQRSGIKTFLCPASVSVAEASAFLEGCENLEGIRFEGTGIKDVDLEYFFFLKNIKKIDFSGLAAVNLINCSSPKGREVRDKVVLPYYVTEIN